MPLHLALQILQSMRLGLECDPTELRIAYEFFCKEIRKQSLRNFYFSNQTRANQEQIERDLFSVLLFRLVQKDFPTERQAYKWLIISIYGFFCDLYHEEEGLSFFEDIGGDEEFEHGLWCEANQKQHAEKSVERKELIDEFCEKKEVFIESYLQTVSPSKHSQVRASLKEMEDLHLFCVLSFRELVQGRSEEENTIQKRHSRLRIKMREHLQRLQEPNISGHDKEVLSVWLALLDGKPGNKYDT
jgi:hypothetical protein